jgi:hypothetical protein
MNENLGSISDQKPRRLGVNQHDASLGAHPLIDRLAAGERWRRFAAPHFYIRHRPAWRERKLRQFDLGGDVEPEGAI